MKSLFKDEVIAKLRKLPSFLWVIFLAISYFARDVYATLEQAKAMGDVYRQMLQEMGAEQMVNINITPAVVMISILAPIITALIFELIVFLAYEILARRYVMAINRKDFSFRARLVMIVANLILGIINISNFFVGADVIALISSIVDFPVPALLFMWYYEDFRKRFVPKARHAHLFGMVASVYVGIDFIFSLINFISGMMTLAQNTALQTAAISVSFGLSFLMAGVAYVNYRRLKKISDEPEDNNLFIKKEEKPEDDEIFKGLGF